MTLLPCLPALHDHIFNDGKNIVRQEDKTVKNWLSFIHPVRFRPDERYAVRQAYLGKEAISHSSLVPRSGMQMLLQTHIARLLYGRTVVATPVHKTESVLVDRNQNACTFLQSVQSIASGWHTLVCHIATCRFPERES